MAARAGIHRELSGPLSWCVGNGVAEAVLMPTHATLRVRCPLHRIASLATEARTRSNHKIVIGPQIEARILCVGWRGSV